MDETTYNSAASSQREISCTFDPLTEFLAHYANAKSVKRDTSADENLPIEERLKNRIIDGDKLGIDRDLERAMQTYSALEIINTILLDGMKVVGELFGSGEMQLPFVLQSAETMKAAVRYLEPFMEKVEGESSKGVMVLATVKGDVHDIGKNLVDIILTNNGYRVVNLGIKVSLEAMLEAAEREKADAIGMSGLLVKSTAIMKENLQAMQGRDITLPVVLGGAALTRKFVEKDLRELYEGQLWYAQDAFDGLHFMEELKNPKAKQKPATTEAPLTKAAIENLMADSREKFIDLIESIPDADFFRANTFNKWSVRDIVAHLITWEKQTAFRLNNLLAGEAPRLFDLSVLDATNDAMLTEIDEQDRDILIAELEAARGEVLEAFRSVDEELLHKPIEQIHSISKWLPGFTWEHENEHAAKIAAWIEAEREELDTATGAEAKAVLATRALPWMMPKTQISNPTSSLAESEHLEEVQVTRADFPVAVRDFETDPGMHKLQRISSVERSAAEVPSPPFWGSKVIRDIPVDKVWEYLNEVALFRGQWQIRRGKRSIEEFEKQIDEVARPKLNELKLHVKRERILDPKVVYGYFPCWSEGDDLVLLRPKSITGDALFSEWGWDRDLSELIEWQRFSFPRQTTARRLCIADFFLRKEEALAADRIDVVALSAVTVGREASRKTAELFARDEYSEYLFLHGLSVETAEALAEYWHKIMRAELGIGLTDAPEMTRLFSQGYQGSRYSLGYPACPNLEDQTKLFEALRPERIEIELSEEYHLEPEQSTTAIIVHHPAAKYFSIK